MKNIFLSWILGSLDSQIVSNVAVMSQAPWFVVYLVCKWGHEKGRHEVWKGWKDNFCHKIPVEAGTSPLAHTVAYSNQCLQGWWCWRSPLNCLDRCDRLGHFCWVASLMASLHWGAQNASDILHLAYFTPTQTWWMLVQVPASQKAEERSIVRIQETFCFNC